MFCGVVEPGVLQAPPPKKNLPAGGCQVSPRFTCCLRGLRCHVCCDSALQFLKTFCGIECNLPPATLLPTRPPPPGLSRLLVERFGRKKKNSLRQERKIMCDVLRVWRFVTVTCILVHALGCFTWSGGCSFSLSNKWLPNSFEYTVRTWLIHLCDVI